MWRGPQTSRGDGKPETKSLLQMFNLCIRDGQQTMTATMPLIFFVFFTPEDEEQLL